MADNTVLDNFLTNLNARLTAIESATKDIRVLVSASLLTVASPTASTAIPTASVSETQSLSSSVATQPTASSSPVVIAQPTASVTYKPAISDDYTTYATTAAFLKNVSINIGGTGTGAVLYNDGVNAYLATIDPEVVYNGHHTLKYNFPAGVATTPQLWASLPNGLSKVAIRAKIRFSEGFTTLGVAPLNAANAYKILGWGWQGADGRGTLEYTNLSQYTFNWSVKRDDGTLMGPVVEKNGPNVVGEWSDKQWYDFIIYYEQTSSTTVRQRWWLAQDGQTPQLNADIVGKMTAGTVPLLNRVGLGMNFNRQRSSTNSEALWYGQWEVVDMTLYPDPFKLNK